MQHIKELTLQQKANEEDIQISGHVCSSGEAEAQFLNKSGDSDRKVHMFVTFQRFSNRYFQNSVVLIRLT